MSESLHVESDNLGASGKKLLDCVENLNTEIGSLGTSIADLCNNWTGPSSEAFMSSWVDEEAKLKQLASLLDSKGRAVIEGSVNFAETEALNAAMASKLGNN